MRKGVLLMAELVAFCTSSLCVEFKDFSYDSSKELLALCEGDKVNVVAPAWEFYFIPLNLSAVDLEEVSDHKLGPEVSRLYAAFETSFVVKEEVVPGDPLRRTVIRKPDIYNAVRKVERMLTDKVKRGELRKEAGASDFMQVLNVAMAAVDTECGSFEKALQQDRKDPDRLFVLFQRVSLRRL